MKYIVLYVLCAAMTMLTACGPKPQELLPDRSGSAGRQTGIEEQEKEDPPSCPAPSAPSDTPPDRTEDVIPFLDLEKADPVPPEPPNEAGDPVLRAYAQVLTRLLEEHTFPDGRADGFTGELHGMEENKFALADVDGDGQQELVIKFVAADLENHRGLVLNADPATGKVDIQLDENPGMVFFENGAVLAQWTANPGKGGSFWPFSLYEYRPELDSYSYVGGVDAWDRHLDPDHYPDRIDRSGTGFVYYLLPDGPKEDAEAVDAQDYQDWILSYVGNGAMLEPDYKDLTAENIGALNKEASREQAQAEAPAP